MFSCTLNNNKPVVHQSVYIYLYQAFAHESWATDKVVPLVRTIMAVTRTTSHAHILLYAGHRGEEQGHWPAEQYTLLIALVLNTTITAWTWTGDVELQTNVCEHFTIMEKVPTLLAIALIHLRHYAKWAPKHCRCEIWMLVQRSLHWRPYFMSMSTYHG